MTTDLEIAVAGAVESWRRAGPGAERDRAGRHLADVLERWIAALLSADARWPLQDRWYDDLVFVDCLDRGDAGVSMLGWIWRIDTQTRYPFRVRLRPSTGGLAGFEVCVADEYRAEGGRRGRRARDLALALANSELEWSFHFVRDG